jgi:hypothetical protein
VSKLLDLLERVAPHVALFPRWAKSLLLVTLASVALSVIVYAAWHDSALRARDAAAASRDVTADLTGSGGNDIGLIKRRLASANSARSVDYLNSGGDPTMQITPVNAYLDTLANGGTIRPGDFGGISTADLPLLDLKAANNSKRVVYLTRAVFDVESSAPDRTAIPVVDELTRTARAFDLANEGWGPMRRVVIRYRLVPRGAKNALERPFPVQVNLGTVREEVDVDLSGGTRAAGVDLGALKRIERSPYGMQTSTRAQETIRRALRPFPSPKALVAGEISYWTETASGRSAHRTVMFTAPVLLYIAPGFGGVFKPPSRSYYNVRLKVSGRHYRQVVGIDEELRPGAVKRFEIRVYAPRSSVHRFRVHLVYGTGEILAPPTELHLFVPRTHEIPQPETNVDASRSS